MGKPNQKAIASAEELLRRLRTGELTGFVAIATNEDDLSSYSMAGRINLTQTVCLLEDMKIRALDTWVQRFSTTRSTMTLVDIDGNIEEDKDT